MTLKTDGLVDNNDVRNLILQTKQEIITVLNNVYKVGDIKASTARYGQSANWVYCDGQALSRTQYAELYAMIGTNFGSGNGSTTFNVPDYRGKFLRGFGGDSAGSIYTTQAEGLPNISGSFSQEDIGSLGRNLRPPYFRGKGVFTQTKANGVSTKYGTWDSSRNSTGYCPTVNFSAHDSNAIYGSSNHVTPINQAVHYFIKAKPDS